MHRVTFFFYDGISNCSLLVYAKRRLWKLCPFLTLLAAAGVFLRRLHGPLSFTDYAYMRLSTLVYALKRRVSCGSNLRARYTRARAGYASFIIYRTLEYGESTTVSTRFCAPRRQSAYPSLSTALTRLSLYVSLLLCYISTLRAASEIFIIRIIITISRWPFYPFFICFQSAKHINAVFLFVTRISILPLSLYSNEFIRVTIDIFILRIFTCFCIAQRGFPSFLSLWLYSSDIYYRAISADDIGLYFILVEIF